MGEGGAGVSMEGPELEPGYGKHQAVSTHMTEAQDRGTKLDLRPHQ